MLPYIALTTAMLLWASSFIALKIVFQVFDPLFVLFCRMVIATALLLPLMAWQGTRWHYRAGDWKWILLLGLCEPCLYFLFEAQALLYTSASQAGLITATLPVLAALGALLFLHERLSRRAWCGIAISLLGVAWLTLTSESSAAAPNPLLGNTLEFLAMVCATGYVLMAKKLSSRYSALAITAIQTVMGCVWFGVSLLTPWASWPQVFPTDAVFWVVYLGAFITLGAYGLYTWSVAKVPVAMAAAFINLIPVFTLLLAGLLLDERLNGWQWLACLLVLGGVMLSQSKRPATAA